MVLLAFPLRSERLPRNDLVNISPIALKTSKTEHDSEDTGMASCKFLSVLSLGLALIIGCGEGADTGTSDTDPTGNAGHAMGMEAGSGVGGGAMHEAVAEEVFVFDIGDSTRLLGDGLGGGLDCSTGKNETSGVDITL